MRLARVILAAGLLLAGVSALQAQQNANTVNGYTAAQRAKAEGQARAAGYTPTRLAYVQAGNIFLWATKGGEEYILTITPEGAVHAGGRAVKGTGK